MPESLKDSALAVRVYAVVPAAQASPQPANPGPGPVGALGQSASATGDKAVAWQAESIKYTVPGTPVPFKFIGTNVVILVQVTPFSRPDSAGVVLVAQGQVWVKSPDGRLSYHTTIDTLSVEYGETVFFFPLGLDPGGHAPIRLEIAILHAADLPAAQGPGGEDKSKAGDKTSDKAGK
jgi:hypothetical protein